MVALSDDTVAILEAEEREFIELFGREPQGSDPVMFRSMALLHDETMDVELDRAAKTAGIPADIRYAMRKTGLTVTKTNARKLTGKDMRDWNDAIAEFNSTGGDEDEDDDERFHTLATLLVEELQRCRIVLGLIPHRGGPLRYDKQNDFAVAHMMFCLSKISRTLRTIEHLTVEGFGEDALTLVRSVFAGYLHAAFLARYPEKSDELFTARIGLVSGKHEYVIHEKTGRTDYTRVRELSTGRILNVRITFKHMAASTAYGEDEGLYEALYDFLSSYAHPDIRIARSFLAEDGDEPVPNFEYDRRAMFLESRAIATFIGAMLAHVLSDAGCLCAEMTADLHYYLARTRDKLTKLLSLGFPEALKGPFEARLARFPQLPTSR